MRNVPNVYEEFLAAVRDGARTTLTVSEVGERLLFRRTIGGNGSKRDRQ